MKFIALVFITLLSFASKTESFAQNSDRDISIMSFNLRYDNEADGENQWSNRKEACVIMINEIQPSVFGIQEGLDTQVAYLSDNLLDYDYVGVGRDDGESMGEFSAVFYLKDKFELLESNTFWLSETPETSSYGWDAACKRIVTWVHLKDLENDQLIYVFNTHFDHEGEIARKESAKLLIAEIQKIAEEDTPVYITGDFNALISNSILAPILNNDFVNAKEAAEHTDSIKSFNFFGKKGLSKNIDFIFFKNSKVSVYRTVNEGYGVPFISDHYPIVAFFNY